MAGHRLDYDQDGRFDLLVPTTAGVPVLLHNEGGRTFATVPSGLGTGEYHEFNPVWLTDDPYPDLLVASGGKDRGGTSSLSTKPCPPSCPTPST